MPELDVDGSKVSINRRTFFTCAAIVLPSALVGAAAGAELQQHTDQQQQAEAEERTRNALIQRKDSSFLGEPYKAECSLLAQEGLPAETRQSLEAHKGLSDFMG